MSSVQEQYIESAWALLGQLSEDESNYNAPPDSIDLMRCKHCNSTSVVVDESNYTCQKCGSVLARFIDMNAEWRFYGADDNNSGDPSRCGMPINDLLPDSSLGLMMGYCTGNESYEMMMLRKYHRWNSMTYKERSLYKIFDTLTINAVNNGIPKTIIEQSKVYYKKLSEIQITRGKNRSGLIASSMYMSCKQHGVPRSTKEIAQIFNLKQSTITKGCNKFMEMMDIQMESSTPVDFIQRFCSKMNLDQSVRDLTRHVVITADRLNLVCESTPPSIAAASIYLVGVVKKINFSKKDLAECCDISQVTIGKCYKKLYSYRHHLFPENVIPSPLITEMEGLAIASGVKPKAKTSTNKIKKSVTVSALMTEMKGLTIASGVKPKAKTSIITNKIKKSGISEGKHEKRGQTKETPIDNDPLCRFYTSLLRQRPNSQIAMKWGVERGLVPDNEIEQV